MGDAVLLRFALIIGKREIGHSKSKAYFEPCVGAGGTRVGEGALSDGLCSYSVRQRNTIILRGRQ